MIINYTNSRYKRNDEDDELLKAVERVSGSTYKGVTSNTPTLPKISSLERASIVGNPSVYTPKQREKEVVKLPKTSFADKASIAAEKASRVYLQNSPDVYTPPKPKPIQGPRTFTRSSTEYLQPVTGSQQSQKPSLTPVKTNNEGWRLNSFEEPATPTPMRQGTSVFDRVYNAFGSIGDNLIGSDKSLKAALNASYNNEKEYKQTLRNLDNQINELMLQRNKYSPESKEYKQLNEAINNLYKSVDNLRNRTADVTEANEFMQNSAMLREQAKEGLSGPAKQLVDTSISVGNSLVPMIMTGFNPTATVALMGAQTAGNRANELSNEGVSARDALGRGVVSGVIEGLTEKIGIDNLYGIVKSNNVKLLSSLLRQAASEGTEEGLSNVLNYAADRMAGDKKSFDWDDLANSVIQGVYSGFMFGVGGNVANRVLPKTMGYADMNSMNTARELNSIKFNDVLPVGDNNYSSDISNANINVTRNYPDGTTSTLPISQYLDEYSKGKQYAKDITNNKTLALPKPSDYYTTSEGILTQRPTETWNTPQKYETVYDNFETVEFKPSGEFEIDDGSLSKRDVSAYNFVKSKADELNTTTKKVYDAYKKSRDGLFNKVVDEWFDAYKNYKPQGTQMVISNNEQIGGVPVDRYTRISNNEPWYSEVYAIYGHKPNQSQLKQFVEMKVTDDINNGRGQYVDAETAKTIRTYDNLLNGYNKITDNGEKNVLDIRLNQNGNYEVDYGTPREQIVNDPTKFYQGRMVLQEGVLPDATGQQMARVNVSRTTFNVLEGNIVTQKQGFTDGTHNYYKDGKEWIAVDATTGEKIDKTYKSLVSAINANKVEITTAGEITPNITTTENVTTADNTVPEVKQTETVQPSNNNLGIVNQDVLQLFEDVQKAKEESRGLYQSIISGTAPFERIAKTDKRTDGRNIYAIVNRYGQKGGTVRSILEDRLYDINGNVIDDRSFVDVLSQVPEEQNKLFNEYWHELHNIDRQAQNKPVTKHTAEESKKIVADIEAEHPEFKGYIKDISSFLDKFEQVWAVDTGLITPKMYDYMKQMYKNYVPTYRVEEGGGTGASYTRSGKKLKGKTGIGRAKGSTAEVMSFDEAITKKVATIVNAATKNDISREIFSFAQAQPADAAKNGILIDTNKSKEYTGQLDIDEYLNDIDKNIAKEISKGNYEMTFYNYGVPQTMKISRDVWEAFNFLDSKLGGVKAFETASKIGRFFTNPMRALTTTYNPLFGMTNTIRDFQSYAINNTAKNSAVALKNYIKAIKGVATNSDLYRQYKALGGSQNGYYGSNIYEQAYKELYPGSKTSTDRLKDAITVLPRTIESFGEFTEKLPRFAEYLNTIDRLGNTDAGRLQASLNAADVTVNFNRSSTLSTFANAFVPYFNAGLQGMDKTFRQIKSHPVKTGVRATASVFLPTLILYLVNKDNPHWEDVKDGVKDSYYLIPNTFGPTDENGYAETFIRLPKSREFGALFSASFERFIRAFDESEETGKGLTETLPKAFTGYTDTLANSVSPPDILGDNILGSIRRLGTNTAWHGGTIIPSNLENVSPENQYDINTSRLAMQIAEQAQKIPGAPDWLRSPMKVDYLIDSYGGYGGDLLQGLTSRKNIGSTESETLKNSLYTGVVQPFINRLTTDSAYSSYNLDRFYDEIDNLETAANDRNINENLPSEYRTPEEKVLSDFTSARNDISDITKQERAILESAMPIAEKNKQIRELKQQKNEIAKNMLQSEDDLYSDYQDLYIPVISGLTDSRQEAARQLNKEYGLTYDEYADLYAKYSEINKEDIKPRMKATKFEEYLNSLGYTDQYKITPVLKDEFSYFTASPATSYYDSKSYQLVDGILPVETYADLSSLVYGLESGVDYPKGEKSPFAKSLIDAYLEKYGYNPSSSERAKIYEAMGVAKSYWY